MAPRKQQADDVETMDGPYTEIVTYVPGEGDPATTKWAGQTFHANMPKELTAHATGTETQRLNHHIITSAENNPRFTVGKGGKKRKPATEPTTADEYRGYLASWLHDPQIETPEQMIERFARETDLRERCDVGGEDYDKIRDIFMPKLSDLAKHQEMTEGQVAHVWLNYGFNQLPW